MQVSYPLLLLMVQLLPDTELLEYVCLKKNSNKDTQHLVAKQEAAYSTPESWTTLPSTIVSTERIFLMSESGTVK